MSIRDYNKKFVVINGVTNEHIPIPTIDRDTIVLKDFKTSEIILIQTILAELRESDTVTVCRSYMKD